MLVVQKSQVQPRKPKVVLRPLAPPWSPRRGILSVASDIYYMHLHSDFLCAPEKMMRGFGPSRVWAQARGDSAIDKGPLQFL